MRCMILAAGFGKRMLPLTATTPKPLIEIQGQPLIVWHLRKLATLGITQVVINCHHLGAQIQATLGNGAKFGLEICYSVEETLLNTGGGIVRALPLLGDAPFLLLSADIFTDFPLAALNPPTALAHLVLVPNPAFNPQGDYALTADGFLCPHGTPTYTYANIAVIHPDFFANAPAGAFPLNQLLSQHVAQHQVTGEVYSGLWHNIGTVAQVQALNQAVCSG